MALALTTAETTFFEKQYVNNNLSSQSTQKKKFLFLEIVIVRIESDKRKRRRLGMSIEKSE